MHYTVKTMSTTQCGTDSKPSNRGTTPIHHFMFIYVNVSDFTIVLCSKLCCV